MTPSEMRVMSISQLTFIFLTVVSLSAGQALFKIAASGIEFPYDVGMAGFSSGFLSTTALALFGPRHSSSWRV
jgi:hypothetical protein